MTSSWRKGLSFSDRLDVTSKMQKSTLTYAFNRTTAYKTANPNWSSSEATKHAKASEEAIRNDASSIPDYHERCNKLVQDVLSPDTIADDTSDASEDEEPLPSNDYRVGRYSNVQHWKDGLFSEIFKATLEGKHPWKGRYTVFALKLTTPSASKPPHDAQREARILTAAKGDCIIPLLETFNQPGGRFVLSFPYMRYDLETLLQLQKLTTKSRKTVLRHLFTGLAHLHQLGIIHRDVKPSNILLATSRDGAYIADFGIAWSSSDAASEPVQEKILDVGTTCYRPPELLFGNSKYDNTLDLWAAGCVAAQVVCLNGKTLFDAGDLGSELALIKSIFETLGTPDLEVWLEAAEFPDWGKMNFRQYPGFSWSEILPGADPSGVDFVGKLVVYESKNRMTAEEALKHPYLL